MTSPQVRLAAVRRTVLSALVLQAACRVAAAIAAVLLVGLVVDLGLGLSRSARLLWIGAALGGGAAVALWLGIRARRAASNEVLALWIEAHHPLDYLLVTAADPRFSGNLEIAAALQDRPFESAARRAAWRGVRTPAVTAGALITILALVPSPRLARITRPEPGDILRANPGRSALRLRPIVARYRAPDYAGGASVTLEDPTTIRGLEGGDLEIAGRGEPEGIVASVGERSILPTSSEVGWRVVLKMPSRPSVVHLADGDDERLLGLEPIPDSIPTVVLRLPSRDTVVRAAAGSLTLDATVSDDHGVAATWFEYVISSGSGELFQFRTGTVGRHVGRGLRDSLRTDLDLAPLILGPGDVLHVRAVARDQGPASRGPASSETRSLRVARSGDSDTSAVIVMPPLPSDTAALSQRMLIQLAEALEARRPALPRVTVTTESQEIGRDQARLRREVADVIFLRLSGEPGGEHAHGADTVTATLTPEELLRAAEAATAPDPEQQLDFREDEVPVVGVSRPLLEAYNAMWDASRELDIGEPGRALPHMRVALEAIQRARLAERVYLRGRSSPTVVNLQLVRLSGKREGIVTQSRSPLPPGSRAGRLRRLNRAVGVLAADTDGARDSLLLLRIDLLADQPGAAASVGEAIAILRQGGDPRPALAAARQRLAGRASARPQVTPWGLGGER